MSHSVDAQWFSNSFALSENQLTASSGFKGAVIMLKNQMWLFLLILYAKNLEAFLASPGPDPTTVTPTVHATAASGVTMGIVKEVDNLTKVGEEIINVATKIREIVEDWSEIMTASTPNEGLSQNVETVKSNINLESSLVSQEPDPKTETPSENAPTATGVMMETVEEDDNRTKVSEEIINVSMEIHKSVKDWSPTTTTWTTNEGSTQKVETAEQNINLEVSLAPHEPESTTETPKEDAPTAGGVTMETLTEDDNRTKISETNISEATENEIFLKDGSTTTWTTDEGFTQRVETAKPNMSLEASMVSQVPDPITVTPTETAATNTGVTMETVMDDHNRTPVGEKNISVTTEIHKFVENWRTTTTAWTTNEGLTQKVDNAGPNMSLEASSVSLNPDPTTVRPTENATTSRGVTLETVKVDNNRTKVTKDISNVSTEFRNSVGDQTTSMTACTTNEGLSQKVETGKPNNMDQTGRLGGERVDQGSEIREGNGSGFDLNVFINNGTTVSPCLPVPSDWPICKQLSFFTLPNIFNHTSVEEVGTALKEWAWLVRAGCHHSTEWFLCLLLAPRCTSPSAPIHFPCRSFCFVLQDSCWASLENGRLPVECHLLPEQAQEPERPACASVSNRKGNTGGLKCILCIDTFQIQSHFFVCCR